MSTITVAHELEDLGASILFSQFLDPQNQNEIISNKNFPLGEWESLCSLESHFANVSKRVIPVDLRPYCMLVISEVQPNTTIPRHSHMEAIIRFVIEGSFILNGENIGLETEFLFLRT